MSQLDNVRRVGDFGTLVLNGMSPSHPSPWGSGSQVKREAERLREPDVVGDSEETMCS